MIVGLGLIAIMFVGPTLLVGFFWAFFLTYTYSLGVNSQNVVRKGIFLSLNVFQVMIVSALIMRWVFFQFGIGLIGEYEFLTPEKYLKLTYFTYWAGTLLGLLGASALLLHFRVEFTLGKKILSEIAEYLSKTLHFRVSLGFFLAILLVYMMSSLSNGIISEVLLSKFSSEVVLSLGEDSLSSQTIQKASWSLINIIIIMAIYFIFNVFFFKKIIDPYGLKEEGEGQGIDALFQEKLNKVGLIVGTIKGKLLSLNWKDINHHIHVLGQLGAGKSVFLRNIYAAKIVQNQGVILIDLKSEIELKEEFRGLCEASKRENDFGFFDINDIENSFRYNPFIRGNATELKDKMMMAFEWSESYYKFVADSFLINIFKAFVIVRDEKGEIPTLRNLYDCAKNPRKILELHAKISKKHKEIREDLVSLYLELARSKSALKELKGISSQLETMIKSEFGELLCSQESVDLLGAMKENKVILVMLDGQTYGETAKRIARFLMVDIRSCSGHIVSKIAKVSRPNVTVIVDESADIITTEELGEMLAGTLNRSRASGIGFVLAHQSMGDFGSDKIKTKIIDNTETLVTFVQKDDESSEKISKMIGTFATEKKTFQIEKSLLGTRKLPTGSSREVEEFIIHPNKIKNLDVGKAIYFAKKPTRIGELSVRFLNLKGISFGEKTIKSRINMRNFLEYKVEKIEPEIRKKYLDKNEKKEEEGVKMEKVLEKVLSVQV
jgi:hypothetical protein